MKNTAVISVLVILTFLFSASAGQKAAGTSGEENGPTIDRYMEKAAANGYAGSVLVARGEKVILAKGYGFADRENKVRQTAETVFSIGSITKQFTGAAVLKLETQGTLKVTDLMSKYLQGVPDTSGRDSPKASSPWDTRTAGDGGPPWTGRGAHD